MSFKFPPDSSPPSTPDKSRSLFSNLSNTPAGAPPSASNSFTPQGPPPSTVFGSSQMSARSNIDSPQSLFTKSGNLDLNDSIFGSSIASNDYPVPRVKKAAPAKSFAASQSLFGTTNTNRFDESTSFGDSNRFGNTNSFSDSNRFGSSQMDEDGDQDIEEEEVDDGNMDIGDTNKDDHRFSFLDSRFDNSIAPSAKSLGQRKSIYTNPIDAKRPKLDEKWANQSPLRKGKLSPKKDSAMPSIVRNFASRSRIAPVDEPSDIIIKTEDELSRMYDEARLAEFREEEFRSTLSEVSDRLATIWRTHTARSSTSKALGGGSGVGPGDKASNVAKASFLGSLLLQLHHPPLESAKNGSHSSPLGFAAPRSFALVSHKPETITPVPRVLLDWLDANHAPMTAEIQALRDIEPNPTASSNFWEVLNAAVLRGHLSEAAEILRSADFNYARSALEDGLPQTGYRGAQLQNIQRCVNKALQILESCPSIQNGDWDVSGPEWESYRKRVFAAVTDLEGFAEGDVQEEPEPPVSGNRFQAVNFGLKSNTTSQEFSFAQSSRMAESRVPWAIYQNLRSLYRIILGDTNAIMSRAQDWIEATVGLTVWWDGEDDEEEEDSTFGASTNLFLRPRLQKPQSLSHNAPVDAYIRRLGLAFSSATNAEADANGFRINSLSTLEVGLASVFEGDIDGVLELLQTWSLCVASAVVEVATAAGWLEKTGAKKPMSGLTENDLMVLSYAQNDNAPTNRITKNEILTTYASGLFERRLIENETGARKGWELALEVLSRLRDSDKMQKSVSGLLDKLPLDTPEQMDKVVLLCSELGLDKEGRRVSERFGDMTVANSEDYGLAMVCYARAHNRRKVKSVVDLLISYSLVQSRAFPSSSQLDEQLLTLVRDPNSCLSAVAAVDEEAAGILQFYFSGYATLRRFYETRDEAIGLQDGQRPRFRPLARRRAAGQALVAVITSAADSIYGGLYDPSRDSAIQVDGLLALLGEALAFINQPTPVLSVSQQFAILSAIEDLETVTPRVYAQCEECFRSTLIQYQSFDDSSAESQVLPPSPRTLLRKSVSSGSAPSTFSFIGNDMIESARTRSMSGSAGGSGVLVSRPSEAHERGWDWRASLPEDIKGQEVLRMLRLGLAKGLSFGALGCV